MDLNKFTLKAWEALQGAQSLALNLNHSEISPIHLVVSLLEEKESVIPSIFKKLDINLASLKLDFDKKLKAIPKVTWDINVQSSNTLAKVITAAESISKEFQDEYISMEHLLLSAIKHSSQVKEIFEKYWLNEKILIQAIKDLRWWERITDNDPEGKFQALEKYTIDLTAKVSKWNADPIIGRDEEIRRTIQILSRRTKNNPVLVWDAWVWKTAVAEWLAQRIVARDVPETLLNKKVLSLDMWALIAWAKYRWEFEERLKAVLKEVWKAEWKIILFIDEIHTIVWAWAGEGAMDAGNLIKPALARWELHCVWATTLNEYRKYIEKDPALERRFQPVMINEPTQEDAIAILRWIKSKYEIHHWIKIKDWALVQSVILSSKYLPDRKLPDKAIDLMDEAASALRMQLESQPKEIDDLQRKILRLEVERESIKKEEKDKKRLEELEKKLSEEKEKLNTLMAKWKEEKSSVEKMKELKTRLDRCSQDAEQCKRELKFDKLAELQYGTIPEIQKKIKELEQKEKADWAFIREEVTEEDIAKVVSQWTWIPITKLQTTETHKLISMEWEIAKRIVWQEQAVKAVANAIRRSRTGLTDENKPIWSFLFLGPTWVWKTEVAKALAEFLFDDESAMTRFDMSEYMEKHAVSKLIGSPPGYVWFDEWGRLTELVRRKPYSVILFDEVEKAHPDVFNILLQILDDGRLTDSKWRVVNFKNTIIIMTSNIGSQEILEEKGEREKEKKGASLRAKRSNLSDSDTNANSKIASVASAPSQWRINENIQKKINALLLQFFRPEFLNRIDEQIIFHSLSEKDIAEILELQLNKIKERLAKNWVAVEFTKEAKEFLAKEWYDPLYWARPLKRVLKSEVLDKLALWVLEWNKWNKVKVWIKNGEVVFG